MTGRAPLLAATLLLSSACADPRAVLGLGAADCAGCHGAPPATGAHLVHATPASARSVAYGAVHVLEGVAPAAVTAGRYDFGCGSCHPLDPALHRVHAGPPGAADVVLDPAGAPAGSLRARNLAGARYDPVTRTCSGVSCHSSGLDPAAMTSIDYRTTPPWDGAPGALGCDGCHGNPPRYASGGAGTPTANSHLGFDAGGADWGWESGHFGGLPGPAHGGASKHGGGSPAFLLDTAQAAAPITCQACHAATVDPANVATGGSMWLDTTGDYRLPGGDPGRLADAAWRTTQCDTCHAPGLGAPVLRGKVRPLRHVNGRRDVVFDARPSLDVALAGSLPIAPPFAPYYVTWFTPTPSPAGASTTASGYWELPQDAVLVTTAGAARPVYATSLAHAVYDPATKTCANVGCHVGRASLEAAGLVPPLRWGAPYDAFGTTCTGCHAY